MNAHSRFALLLVSSALIVPNLISCQATTPYYGSPAYYQNYAAANVPPAGYQAEVDISMFYNSLAPYGRWTRHANYGQVWYPNNVTRDWQPYEDGHWANTNEYGWLWVSSEPWGWATYHYGRWTLENNRWLWIPGRTWAPAWVIWRSGREYTAWAPMPPSVVWQPNVGLNSQYFNANRDIDYNAWIASCNHHLAYTNMATHRPNISMTQILNQTQIINNSQVIHQTTVINQGPAVKAPIVPVTVTNTVPVAPPEKADSTKKPPVVVQPQLPPPTKQEVEKEKEIAKNINEKTEPPTRPVEELPSKCVNKNDLDTSSRRKHDVSAKLCQETPETPPATSTSNPVPLPSIIDPATSVPPVTGSTVPAPSVNNPIVPATLEGKPTAGNLPIDSTPKTEVVSKPFVTPGSEPQVLPKDTSGSTMPIVPATLDGKSGTGNLPMDSTPKTETLTKQPVMPDSYPQPIQQNTTNSALPTQTNQFAPATQESNSGFSQTQPSASSTAPASTPELVPAVQTQAPAPVSAPEPTPSPAPASAPAPEPMPAPAPAPAPEPMPAPAPAPAPEPMPAPTPAPAPEPTPAPAPAPTPAPDAAKAKAKAECEAAGKTNCQ